jgi:hypothetical protein
VIIMKKKSLVVMSTLKDERELYAAKRAAQHISDFGGAKAKNVELLFILDKNMIEGAILANDEYFGVKQRREFITKDATERANRLLEEAGAIFAKYGIKTKKKVEMGEPEKILRKCSFNSDAILLLNEKLQRNIVESSLPLIIFPEVKPKLSFSNMLKGVFPSRWPQF